MIKRTLSTLALWAVLILTVYYFRAAGLAALMCVFAILAGYEACKLLNRCGAKPSFCVYSLATLALFAPMIYFYNEIQSILYSIMMLPFIFVSFAFWTIKDPYSDFFSKRVVPTFLAFLAISAMLCLYAILAYLFSKRGNHDNNCSGIIIVMILIAAAKFSDVGGYLFGMFFGRHKLSPTISPKKTWEGAVGGVIMSAAVSAAIAYGFKDVLNSLLSPLYAAIIAVPIAISAIASDLLESVLKRRADIKDSGKTIPGIGGALDLADSMLLSAPVGFVLVFLYQII